LYKSLGKEIRLKPLGFTFKDPKIAGPVAVNWGLFF
jgi:hypothetical protein